MKIELTNNWFTEGVLYRKSRNPHEVPDSWRDLLPPHTKIVDDQGVVKEEVDDEDEDAVKGQASKPADTSKPIQSPAIKK